ncbi:hypothetical protein AAMO2058_001499700 [Amorphochlora amoebiformis]
MRTLHVVVGTFLVVFFLNIYSETERLDSLDGGRNDRAEGGQLSNALLYLKSTGVVRIGSADNSDLPHKLKKSEFATRKLVGSSSSSQEAETPKADWVKFKDVDAHPGNDLQFVSSMGGPEAPGCKSQCEAAPRCTGFALWQGGCYLKSGIDLIQNHVKAPGVVLFVNKVRCKGGAQSVHEAETTTLVHDTSPRALASDSSVSENGSESSNLGQKLGRSIWQRLTAIGSGMGHSGKDSTTKSTMDASLGSGSTVGLRTGGKTVRMGKPMPMPTFSKDESTWTVSLSVSLSLALMNEKDHYDYARHLIGEALKPWTLSEGSSACFDNHRDFRKDPVELQDRVASGVKGKHTQECDIKCTYTNRAARDSSGSCTRTSSSSMENVNVRTGGEFDLYGNTRLTSVVPVPYSDWFAFGFNEPLEWPKTADALAAAYISNCGFPKRNKAVEDLPKYGVKVFSYGNCVHNRDESQEPKVAKNNQRGARKINNLKRFKFSLAFENSETPDYITEKFFGSLVAGTIPVVIGAPNAKFFAPSRHSFLHWNDFKDTEALAKHMKYLDSNDTAWLEYMEWKKEGYSDDFKAIVDLTATHSLCRRCIMVGDQTHRFKIPDPITVSKVKGPGSTRKTIFVRERGNFYYHQLDLEGNAVSMEGILRGILENIPEMKKKRWKMNDPPKKPRRVYTLYTIGYKNIILSDDDVLNIKENSKLEFVYV